MGFRDVRLEIDHLGPTRLHIASLTLGPGRALSARDITLRYSPLGLLAGHIDTVRIGDIMIAASLRQGDSVLPFMADYKRTSGDIVLPLDEIDIDESSLNIVSPAGDYEVAYSGTIKSGETSGLIANGKFNVTGGAAKADGTLKGRMDGSGAFQGTAQVSSVTFMGNGLDISSGQAEITAHGSLDGLDETNAQFALVNARVAGVTLDTIDGEANYRPGATRLDLTLNSGNPRLTGTASLRVDAGANGGPTELSLDAGLDAAGFAGLEPAIGQPAEASGKAMLRLNGTVSDFASVSDDIANRIVPRALRLRGEFALRGGRMRLSQSNVDASADGAVDLALEDGALTVGTEDGLTFAAADRGTLHVTERDRKPLVAFGPMIEPADAVLTAALDLTAQGYGSAQGTLAGDIKIDPTADVPVSAAPLNLHLSSSKPLTVGRDTISALDVATTIQGGIDSFEGDTKASFDVNSPRDAALSIDSGQVKLAAKIGRREGAAYAVVNDCATLKVTSVGAGMVTARPGPISLCPDGSNTPLADLRYSEANGATAALAGVLKTESASLRFDRDSGSPVNVVLSPTPIAINVSKPSNSAPLTARLSMAGGRLDLPDYSARVQDVGFVLDLAASAAEWTARLNSLKGRLADTRQIALFAPFNVSADGTLDAKTGKMSARLSDQSGKFVVTATGDYNRTTGDASAEFHADPITFDTKGLQPQKLFPILRGQVTSVSGGVTFDGVLSRKNGVMTSSGNLGVSNLGLQTFVAGIQGVNAAINFNSLLPLSTPPGQHITVKELNPGVVIPDGAFSFQITPDGDYVLEHMSWPWAGGRIFADDVHLRPSEARYLLPLKVEGVDLAAFVKLLDLKDLLITSTIGGELPIVIEKGVPYIRGGKLTDDGKGGVIQYQSPQAANLFATGGPSASLAIKALSDFRFKSAAITVDGALTGNLNLGFHISGFNPELYDGYPVEFNLGVEGRLGELVRAGMASMNVTRELQQRLKEGQ